MARAGRSGIRSPSASGRTPALAPHRRQGEAPRLQIPPHPGEMHMPLPSAWKAAQASASRSVLACAHVTWVISILSSPAVLYGLHNGHCSRRRGGAAGCATAPMGAGACRRRRRRRSTCAGVGVAAGTSGGGAGAAPCVDSPTTSVSVSSSVRAGPVSIGGPGCEASPTRQARSPQRASRRDLRGKILSKVPTSSPSVWRCLLPPWLLARLLL